MRPTLLRLLPALAVTTIVNLTCNKISLHPSPADRNQIIEAQRYFIDSVAFAGHAVNYRASLRRDLRWDQAQTMQLKGVAVVRVPIVYADPILIKANFAGPSRFHIDYLTTLWIYRDSSGQHNARCITSFPDSNFFRDPTRPFTGLQFVEDWQGHPIEKLQYLPGGRVRKFEPSNKEVEALEAITVCYTIDGYNSSPGSDETYSWSEEAGCSTSFVNDDDPSDGSGSSTASGGGSSSASSAFTIVPGNSLIKNIQTYFQCYTNVGGNDHVYTVTVCVDQPDPGTRTPWAFTSGGSSGSSEAGNVVNTGHSFLILTETSGAGTVTRNIGFYPSGVIYPSSPSSPGQLNDDQNHYYNTSGTFTVDNAQFFNILNFISSTSTGTYNLNTNNCTTFVINALFEGGITLPSTIGTWPGGAGNDPKQYIQRHLSLNGRCS